MTSGVDAELTDIDFSMMSPDEDKSADEMFDDENESANEA